MIFPPKPGRSSIAGSQTSFRLNPADGIPYAIGRTAFAGNAVHRETWGKDNEYQGLAVVWSGGGPIQEFEQFQADLYDVNFDGSYRALGKYSDFMWLRTQLGATPSPALPSPVAGFPGWGASQKLSGYAASTWVVKWDEEGKKFPGGLPKPLAILKGAKVYDPRLDSTYPGGSGSCRALDESTYVYSENPWLHALTWALGRWQNAKKVLGVGMALATINVPSFVEAANVADANAWKVGGVVSSVDAKWEVLKMMAQAGGGQCVRNGARLSALVETPRVSIATITRDDLVGKGRVAATQMSRQRINGVIPVFRSEAHGWEQIPADPVRFQTYVDEDGELRTEETAYALVQDGDHAAQLAAYEILNSREFGPIDLPLAIRWLGLEPGDQVDIDIPELGLNTQPCLALVRGLDPSTGNVNVSFRSETTGKHATALGQTTSVPPSPSLQPRDLAAIPAPATGVFDLEAVQGTGANGEAVPILQVAGASDNPVADALVVRYRAVADPAQPWSYVGDVVPTATRIQIPSISPATAYEAQIAYRSYGVVGDWLDLGSAVTGALTAGGFVNGGDLAYEDAVAFNNGTIRESAGGAIATLAGFRTADGTAAGFAGQGALATQNLLLNSQFPFASGDNAWVDNQFREASGLTIISSPFCSVQRLTSGVSGPLAQLKATGLLKFEGSGIPSSGTTFAYGEVRDSSGQKVKVYPPPGVSAYLLSMRYFVGAAWSASQTLRLELQCYNSDGVAFDFRSVGLTSPQAANASGIIKGVATIPADTAYFTMVIIVGANNGLTAQGIVYVSRPEVKPLNALNRLARDNGISLLSDSLAVTDLGISAGFAGQGALATRSTAEWGTHIASRPAWSTSVVNVGGIDRLRADYLYSADGSKNLNSYFPATIGADKTGDATAAAIAGQGILATRSTAEWGTHIANRPAFTTDLTTQGGSPRVKTGYIFDVANSAYLSQRWPQEAGANVTETRTASAIAGQGALATLSELSAAYYRKQVPDNFIADPHYSTWNDALSYWGQNAGNAATIALISDPGNAALQALGAERAVRVTGDGGTDSFVKYSFVQAARNAYVPVNGGSYVRLEMDYYCTAAMTGHSIEIMIVCKRRDGTLDYYSAAASSSPVSAGKQTLTYSRRLSADHVEMLIWAPKVNWLANNARTGEVYFSNPRVIGTRALGSSVVRQDGFSPLTEGDAVTALGTASAIAGQAPAATDTTIEPGADVTANSQRSVVPQFPVVEIKEGQAGNSGTRTVSHTLFIGTAAQTGVSWSIQSNNTGGSCTVNSSTGVVSLSGISASGAYTIRASKNGVNTDHAVNVTYLPAAALGASAKTGRVENSSGWGTSSSYSPLISLSLSSVPVGRLFFNTFGFGANEGCSLVGLTGSGSATYRFRIKLVDGGVTTYPFESAEEQAVSGGAIALTNFAQLFNKVLTIANGGNVTVSLEVKRTVGSGQISSAANAIDVNVLAS